MVQITGSFDGWTLSSELTAENEYQKQFKFDKPEKVVFKFIVDGTWTTNDEYKVEYDENGMKNNYIDAEEMIKVEEFEEEEEEGKEEDKDRKNDLTQVSTSSSFAAVLIPGSSGSNFENVDEASCRNAPIQEPIIESPINQSTSTLPQGTGGPGGTGTNSIQTSHHSGYGLDDGGSNLQNDSVMPGSWNETTKKEGILSRFKGLFK